MCAHNQETRERVGPTPPVTNSAPNSAAISGDESMQSTFRTQGRIQ